MYGYIRLRKVELLRVLLSGYLKQDSQMLQRVHFFSLQARQFDILHQIMNHSHVLSAVGIDMFIQLVF